jgi:hypothetical protein
MKNYPMELDDLTRVGNTIKEQLLQTLEREGFLTKPAVELGAKYAVVVAEPSWFGILFSKLKKDDKPGLRVYIMKEV